MTDLYRTAGLVQVKMEREVMFIKIFSIMCVFFLNTHFFKSWFPFESTSY